MLSFFRNIQHSFFIKLILALTALSFVSLFGVSSYLQPNHETKVVASVGRTKITVGQVRVELNDELKRLGNIYGSNVDMETAVKTGVLGSLVKKIVSRTVLNNTINDMGISISDSSLRRETENTNLFQDGNGNFDKAVFYQMLRLSNMSEGQYFETLRGDVARKHLLAGAYSNPPVPLTLAQNIYKFRNQKRIVTIAEVKTSQMKTSGKPNDDALKEYYEDNKHLFIDPEYRKLTAITLSPASIAKGITVSDEDAKNIYDREINAYTVPEERKVLQILLDTKEDADKAYKELSKSGDFYKTAKDFAYQEKEDTELGWVTTETLIWEMNEPVFKAKKGEIVGPIKSQFGWHIMKVEDIKPKKVTPFNEVKDEIIANIKNEQALDMLYGESRKLEDMLGRGTPLEGAAKEGGFELVKLDFIDDQGNYKNGNKAENELVSPLFLEKAFELFDGEESLLIENEDGMFVVRADETIESKPKSFDEVKTKLVKIWQEDQNREKARSKAEAILKEVEKGVSLAGVAKKHSISTKNSPEFKRTETEKLPIEIVTKAFTLDNATPALVSLDDGFAVITLKKIIEANPSDDAEGVEVISDQIKDNMAEDLGSAMISALSQKYSIKINQDTIDENF